MTIDTALMLGFGLGVRHAADADHLVAIGSLLEGRRSTWAAVRVAALWGAGHTASFLAVGLLVVLAGLRPPPAFETAAELLVALTLAGLGGWQLANARRGVTPAPARSRPVVVGIVNGLAGSASLGLMCATTITPPLRAVAYLALFGLGTVAGMAIVTGAMAMLLGPGQGADDRWWRVVRVGSPAASVVLGLLLASHLLSDHLSP